jgi:type I restriction enzyme S subunit
VKEHGIITSAYLGLKPNERMNPEYFNYLLHAYDLMKMYYSLGGGVRQSLNFADVKWLPILIPPIGLQQEIVVSLNNKTAAIDTLVNDIAVQIEKLKEYRQSVISEAVTGKVEV